MKPGLFGQRLSLSEELKASSFAAHARLQTAPFFAALAACQLPLESYVGQLRAFAVIHRLLESTLDACADDRVASVWHTGMKRFDRLQKDLRYFEPRAVLDLKEAAEAALAAADTLRLASAERPLDLLGFWYVLEGSSLGAAVLRPMYARAFLLAGDDGLAYLAGDARARSAAWEQYRRRMDALVLSVGEREQILRAADVCFLHIETVLRALYPFAPESKTMLATSLNAEAGRHPIPADPKEIAAALDAADACWERYPYFEQRYGERGRRFARSDAAWLATLCRYDAAQIVQQVQWLGRVLAARGMPTLLLQEQLELLADALTSAIPEQRALYERLLIGAADLAAARRAHLSDADFEAISAVFDRSVPSEWRLRFPRTGTLIASAAVDEHRGMEGATQSLLSWLLDKERFPESWIDAAESTVSHTRTLLADMRPASADSI